MRLDEPSWWYATEGSQVASRLLSPLGSLYGWAVERRFRTAAPYRAKLPVICIGNFTVGGTGKTPLSRFVLETFAARGVVSACLTRGYGGSLSGPVWVDRARHAAREAGDEPLLIAKDARVMISRDRAAGLAAIERDGGVDAVVMDDGLQNPSVEKDLTIALVDARRGFGNGHVFPAGPLRARLEFQLGRVDCIVVIGEDPPEGPSPVFEHLKKRFPGPVLRGAVMPRGETEWIAGARILAYAGIANPGRFFRLLESFGPVALQSRAFPDHHAFTEKDAASLLAEAEATGAQLATTEKDLARLAGTTRTLDKLRERSRTLPIEVTFDERDLVRLHSLIDGALKVGARG
ncbi:tetraacyldisaccharide 4'-kinase [Hyphomicrobium nitrativorans NL23]|uniref:Tetraacyldisaccharide 4'-kinase n=1 Tax=Hyphomicrobium nitrativorans NL23 TaxID=1029756 RepID=V5SE18_9HYPH|nr:tetraacyldisaccharide 4'-kinase [Hyphomicrobium nitrativorans]AHB48768.1 tetraacyldisaccharide 4'-kinase [Hyphomicrobium nitrativorans NL23]